MAADLGLNVGLGFLEPGVRPTVDYFRIPYPAVDLASIAIHFVEKMETIIAETRPDVIVRATRFVNRFSQPVAIGVYFGLSMRLDEMAGRRKIRHYEYSEQRARDAFLGSVPRGSKAQKRAVRAACVQRNWPAHDEHSCDALVIGSYALSVLEPNTAHKSTPLLQNV